MISSLVSSPTRVDLAGGTLDLWPLYNFIGGATTVNVAIDVYTRCEILVSPGPGVLVEAADLSIQKSFGNLEEFLKQSDDSLNLHRSVLKFVCDRIWKTSRDFGFHLKTVSQSPVGGGLGGSSSLTVSLLKALIAGEDEGVFKSRSIEEWVNICHNIESEVLHTPTGTQDYYPAFSGGINILTYEKDGVRQEVLSQKGSPLKDYFLLVHTGKSHHSGLNNFEVLKSAVAKNKNTLMALRELKEIAEEAAFICRRGSWYELPEIFRREFEARVKLSPAFSSPEIEKLDLIARQNGAKAVKICGAGGGGCVLVWTDPALRKQVSEACLKEGFKALNALPVDPLES